MVSKGFTHKMIAKVIRGEPRWLELSVPEIDKRLGFFQKSFSLTGDEIRKLSMRLPSLIVWEGTPTQVVTNHDFLVMLMGFEKAECKRMLLNHPEIYMQKFEDKLHDAFDVLHNDVGFSHEMLARFPEAMTARSALECRHRNEVRNTHCYI